MYRMPYNRGPLFQDSFQTSLEDEAGRLITITESKPICYPAPTEYWQYFGQPGVLGTKSRMLTKFQYEDLLKIANEQHYIGIFE